MTKMWQHLTFREWQEIYIPKPQGTAGIQALKLERDKRRDHEASYMSADQECLHLSDLRSQVI